MLQKPQSKHELIPTTQADESILKQNCKYVLEKILILIFFKP